MQKSSILPHVSSYRKIVNEQLFLWHAAHINLALFRFPSKSNRIWIVSNVKEVIQFHLHAQSIWFDKTFVIKMKFDFDSSWRHCQVLSSLHYLDSLSRRNQRPKRLSLPGPTARQAAGTGEALRCHPEHQRASRQPEVDPFYFLRIEISSSGLTRNACFNNNFTTL
jgi:hypothetical protein